MSHPFEDDGSGISCERCTMHARNAVHTQHAPVPEQRAQDGGSRDGTTFHAPMDEKRLNAQGRLVWRAMSSGEWTSLAALSAITGAPEASVSARIRDFRKPEFGGFEVARRRSDESAAWEYRLCIPTDSATG